MCKSYDENMEFIFNTIAIYGESVASVCESLWHILSSVCLWPVRVCLCLYMCMCAAVCQCHSLFLTFFIIVVCMIPFTKCPINAFILCCRRWHCRFRCCWCFFPLSQELLLRVAMSWKSLLLNVISLRCGAYFAIFIVVHQDNSFTERASSSFLYALFFLYLFLSLFFLDFILFYFFALFFS